MESANQALRQYYRVAAPHFDADAAALERNDVSFYLDLARRAGGPVIEFGAGTGRVGIELARAGVNYTGVDIAAPMLEAFRTKLEAEPEAVRGRARVKEGDMRTMHLERRFACAIAPFGVLQHLLTDEDRRRALNRVKAHLVPGGLFVFDLATPTYAMLAGGNGKASAKAEVELERDGVGKAKVKRTITRQFDPANQLMRLHREWLEVGPRGGQKAAAEADLTLRWLHRFEIELWLKQTGFEVLEHYADFERRPFDGVSGMSVVIARPAPVLERTRTRRPSKSSRPRTGGPRPSGRGGPRSGGFRGGRPGGFDDRAPRGGGGGYGYGDGPRRPYPGNRDRGGDRGGYGGGYSSGEPPYPRPSGPRSAPPGYGYRPRPGEGGAPRPMPPDPDAPPRP